MERQRQKKHMKKHLIITSAGSKYGDFLIQHWLRSLKANVKLNDIDIVVIDYGLNAKQVSELKRENVILIKGFEGGHVVTYRFIDAGKFLQKSEYDQVLFIDGGDIIFQDDISHLFEKDEDSFRVAQLQVETMFFEAFIPTNFSNDTKKKIWNVLRNKPVLNAGVLFASRENFISLCNQIDILVHNKNSYGPDQVVVNYVLYQNKVVLLEESYNFLLNHTPEGFVIRDGIFYKKNAEKIVVVHNAGRDGTLRPIKNFGYGKEYNQISYGTYYGKRAFFGMLGFIRKIYSLFA